MNKRVTSPKFERHYDRSRLALLFTLGFLPLLTGNPAWAATLVVDDDGMGTVTDCADIAPCFSTIAAAITAANPLDTIKVCPGIYVENLVIPKALILEGPNAGIPGYATRPFSEAIIDGGLLDGTVQIVASNVTVDGFTIRRGAGTLSSGVWMSATTNDVEILNNVIKQCAIGVYANCDAPSKIQGNLFDVNNEPGPAGGTALYSEITNGLVVDENKFTNHKVNNPVSFSTASSPSHFALSFTDNVIQMNSFGVFAIGISGGVFSGNTITTTAAATSLTLGGGCSQIDVLSNIFIGNERGLRIADYGFGTGPNSDIEAHQNNFAGTSEFGIGLLDEGGAPYSGTLDATCNWYGSINGPHVPTANPSPGAARIVNEDSTTATIVYAPWLNAPPPGGLCNQFGPNTVAANTTGLCISATSCVTVPVIFSRTDVTEARAASVTFQLSANLELCGTPGASIAQGSWLGAWTNKTFQVVSNGGGSYTVDQAILGETPTACGVTTGGTLFTVMIKKTLAAGSGSGTITVTDVDIRDCDNPPVGLAGIPGPPASITIDTTAPAGTSLTALQDKTSNGTDGRTFIDVTVPAVGGSDSVRVRQKGFGNYPEYDDAPGAGSVPAIPATEAAAIAAGWTVAFTTPPGGGVTVSHQPPARDFWYFVAFVVDPCGNPSGATSITSGNLNYHLGDVTPTGTPGDNDVDGLDVSRLGSAYGFTLGPSDPFGDLDVGPTTDASTNGRPLTDNLIGFSDLIMFAINFGTVSFNEPLAGVVDTPNGRPELALATESTADGLLVRVLLQENPGTVKGIHALVDYDRDKLALVSVEQGTLLTQQGQPTFFRHLDEGAAGIHAALLGRGLGIHGSGEIARLRFRGRGAVELVHSDLRDLENRFLGDLPATASTELAPEATAVAGRLELLAAQPNPFNPSTMLRFTLVGADQVNLRIYDVNGRLVRTLVDGVLAPGQHSAFWDGRSSQGVGAGSGVYVVRLTVGGRELTQKIQLLK